MSFQRGQKVYLKNFPFVRGTITNVIGEGPGEDASIIVQPETIRRRASDFESAEIPEAPESPVERFVRTMNGPLGQVPAVCWPEQPSFARQAHRVSFRDGMAKAASQEVAERRFFQTLP